MPAPSASKAAFIKYVSAPAAVCEAVHPAGLVKLSWYVSLAPLPVFVTVTPVVDWVVVPTPTLPKARLASVMSTLKVVLTVTVIDNASLVAAKPGWPANTKTAAARQNMLIFFTIFSSLFF
jgi:hypothetical protein